MSMKKEDGEGKHALRGAAELMWFPGRFKHRGMAIGTSQENVEEDS